MLKEITTTYSGEFHAFAVLTDTFEQAYVPNSVVSSIKLEVGRTYRAGVVENRHDPKGQTPWFVTFIEPEGGKSLPLTEPQVEEEEPAVPELTLSDIVRAALPAMNGEPFLASDLATVAGVNNGDAGTILNNMFIMGEISCAKVYRAASQSKASQTIWCSDVRRLLK